MESNSAVIQPTNNTRIYRPKRGTLALNIFSLFFFLIVMGIPLAALALMLITFLRAENELHAFAVGFGCLLIPLLILGIVAIIQMVFQVIMSFFSYIKTSPDGIEHKSSPYQHIRCNWSDVDKLGKFFLFTDVIYLNSYEVLGFSLWLKTPLRLLRPQPASIPLGGYEGWPDGLLANDLKQYAPRLFESQPANEVVQAESAQEAKAAGAPPESTSMSQEVRLLAAICHASVLMINYGFIIPGILFLAQKKKSSYLGFQALQALTWQVAMFVFNLVASSCMVGVIFIPIFLMIASQGEKYIGLSSSSLPVAVIISAFVMTIGYTVFIIYGIIGAVMTYQGKDFRYVLIGHWIDQSKGAKSTTSE